MNILTDILSLLKRKKYVDAPKPDDVLVLGIHEEPDMLGIASPVPYKAVKLIKIKDLVVNSQSCIYVNVPDPSAFAGIYRDTTTIDGQCYVNLRRLKSLSLNLTIVENGDFIDIDTTAEANEGENVGGGAELYLMKVGEILKFRTLTSSDASVTITQNADTIDLVVSGGGEDLAATLLIGNTTGGRNIITSDDDVIKAATGDAVLNLRLFPDTWFLGNLTSSTTTNSFIIGSTSALNIGMDTAQQFGLEVKPTSATLGGYDTAAPASFFRLQPKSAIITYESDLITPQDTIDGVIVSVESSVQDRNGSSENEGIALFLNSGTTAQPTKFNANTVRSVALGGKELTVNTDDTAYANQISLQQAGNTFDALLQPSATTADRTYTLPDRSGIVYVEDPNIVHVFSASDLPAALVTNTTYVIHGAITTANTVLVANQNTAIVGLNRDRDRLIYTGNTAFINILDADFFINNICFEATDPASLVIDARNYTAASFNEGRNKILHITNCQFRNCYNVCDFEGFDLIDIENTLFWYIKAPTIGLRYLNTSKIEITSCEFIRWFDETTIPTPGGWSTAAMFEIQPNGAGVGIGAVNISSSLFHPQQTQDGIKIDNSSTTGFGTISANTFVNVGLTTGVVFSPVAFGLPDYSQTSTQTYDVFANQGVLNSTSGVVMTVTGNTTNTLLTASTPTKVNTGTLAVLQAGVRYTVTTDGRCTYIGSKQVYVSIHGSLTFFKLGGGSADYTFYIYKNGVLLSGSGIDVVSGGATANGAISLTYGTLMNQNDYIEIYVENTVNNDDILVKSWQVLIRE
jgi:hypothetical protein